VKKLPTVKYEFDRKIANKAEKKYVDDMIDKTTAISISLSK
jgi:hypothetical protein